MPKALSRAELIEVVRLLLTAEGSEQELDELENLLQRSVPHPEVSDLLYYPDCEMTPEEIVDRALAYSAIRLPDDGDGS